VAVACHSGDSNCDRHITELHRYQLRSRISLSLSSSLHQFPASSQSYTTRRHASSHCRPCGGAGSIGSWKGTSPLTTHLFGTIAHVLPPPFGGGGHDALIRVWADHLPFSATAYRQSFDIRTTKASPFLLQNQNTVRVR